MHIRVSSQCVRLDWFTWASNVWEEIWSSQRTSMHLLPSLRSTVSNSSDKNNRTMTLPNWLVSAVSWQAAGNLAIFLLSVSTHSAVDCRVLCVKTVLNYGFFSKKSERYVVLGYLNDASYECVLVFHKRYINSTPQKRKTWNNVKGCWTRWSRQIRRYSQ